MSRSCGTCRDRRILCDRATPTCTQCARSNRICKGYGIRLSWPKGNDGRRAVVGGARERAARAFSGVTLLNVTDWDIKLHDQLAKSKNDYDSIALSIPAPFSPVRLVDTESQLLQYFECMASRSLTTLGYDPRRVGDILIRMALMDTSPSATAVRHSLLGLSSLHRYGLQSQAFELKVSAIKALHAASHTNIGPVEAVQHVAAGMLLCSFEIHTASCTSSQWRWYIGGICQVLNASSLLVFRCDRAFTAMTDWVYYHESLGQFSALHWRPGSPVNKPRATACTGMLRVTPSTFNSLLALLCEACQIVSTAELSNNHNLPILNHKLQTVLPSPNTDTILDLFHTAILVYLNRMTNHALEPPSTTQSRIQRAFSTFSSLSSCDRQFPLFILGCEARTDEDRCTILELIDRTEKAVSSRSLFIVRTLIERLWVQDDLANGGLDYREKMTGVISVCGILPTFV